MLGSCTQMTHIEVAISHKDKKELKFWQTIPIIFNIYGLVSKKKTKNIGAEKLVKIIQADYIHKCIEKNHKFALDFIRIVGAASISVLDFE